MFNVDMKHKYAGKIANTKEINSKKILFPICQSHGNGAWLWLGCKSAKRINFCTMFWDNANKTPTNMMSKHNICQGAM